MPTLEDQVDLIPRDSDGFKSSMIQYLKDRAPDLFTNYTESDLGIILLEAVAFSLGSIAQTQNRLGNEVYIQLVRQYRNAVLLAKGKGYTPYLASAASVDLYVDTAELALAASTTYVVQKGASISAGDLTFEVAETYTLAYDSLSNEWTVNGENQLQSPRIGAVEGRTETQTEEGNGAAFQSHPLAQSPVIAGSVRVTVDGVPWSEIDSIVLNPDPDNQEVFQANSDANSKVTVSYGDGILGTVPPLGSIISYTYRVGGGSRGRVIADAIRQSVAATRDGQDSALPVSNPNPATGGQDQESLASIKQFAVPFLKANDRAINRASFEALSAGFSDGATGTVAKAGVIADPSDGISNVVTVYVWTEDNDGALVDAPPQPLKDALFAFLDSRRVETVHHGVVDGVNLPIDLVAQIRVAAGFNPGDVKAAVETAVFELFRQKRVRHDNELRLSWITDTIDAVPGVLWSHVTSPECEIDTGTAEELESGTLPDQTAVPIDEVELPATSSSVDGFYCNYRIKITGGTGAGQIRKLVTYSGTTKRAELDPREGDWDPQPDATSAYTLTHPRLIKLDSSAASTVDDFYNNRVIYLTAGSGVGQARFIVDYQRNDAQRDDGPFIARIDSNWSDPPGGDTQYQIFPDLQCQPNRAFVHGAGSSVTVISGEDES